MKKQSWAIRLTETTNGHSSFLREGGAIGHGKIWTFYDKAAADARAERLREVLSADMTVTVIERSHGRRFEGDKA